jgi:hypothetical protein
MANVRRMVRVSPDTLSRDLNGEGILLQLETGQYFGLNTIGQRMWQLMIEHGDLSVVESMLLAEFAVEPALLAADLERFTNQLVEKKLVVIETTAE